MGKIREQIIKLREQGLSVSDIASKVDRVTSVVNYHLKKAKEEEAKQPRKKWTKTYYASKAELVDILDSVWLNLATADKVKALATILKKESNHET